jgi:hypothetical protein
VIKVNLAPEDARRRNLGRTRLRSVALLALGVFIAFGSLGLGLNVVALFGDRLGAERQRLDREVSELRVALKDSRQRAEVIKREASVAASGEFEREFVGDVMRLLERGVPREASLSAVVIERGGFELRGVARDSTVVEELLGSIKDSCVNLDPAIERLRRIGIGRLTLEEFVVRVGVAPNLSGGLRGCERNWGRG